MVTLPGCEGLFEPLLRYLEDHSTPCDDRVDVYLRLTERLREEEDVFALEVCTDLARLLSIIKVDIQRTETDLCQAALQALGHCMYQEEIACSLTQSDGTDLLIVLATLIKTTEDKSVCTRALWCLAKQNLMSETISNQLDSLLSSLEFTLDKQLQSVTVDHEALAVIVRFLLQLPRAQMIKTVDQWSKVVFPLLTSSASKVRDRALEVLSVGFEHMVAGQDKVLKILMPLLKGGLVKELTRLSTDKKELFVLKAWSHLVPILGKTLHRDGMLINEMLKLVEQGFKSVSVDVQIMAYTMWSVLIDSFALSPEVLCTPKRLKLLMTPFLNTAVRERHMAVESVRLATWWHLVCVLGPQITELFDQVCIPLLQFLFGTNIDQVNRLKNREGFTNLRCPPTPTNGNLADKMAETPRSCVRRSLRDIGTPKTPTIKNTSFSHGDKQALFEQGCGILEDLLRTSQQDISHSSTVERLQAVVFKKAEDFRRHSTLVINTVKEALRLCGREMKESLCHSIWSYLVDHVQRILERGQSSDHGDVCLPLLAITQEIVDNEYVFPAVALKMLEKLSRLPNGSLSHHTACLHSKENPQGSPALLLVQLLFTQSLLGEASTNERFHVTFERLINCGMTAMSGHLSYLQTVLNLLDKGARFITNKDTLWRLWSSASSSLNGYIIKTNDVNQGDALEHDFSTMHTALTFPVKHIMDNTLMQPTAKQVHKSLGELYRSFTRAAALVSTAEPNVCAEELCGKLLTIWDEKQSKDVVFLTGLVNLLGVIVENIDFSVPGFFAMTTAVGKSPNMTPTKRTKRQQRPMGNLTSVVHLLAKIVLECDELNRCKGIAQSSGILPSVVTSLIDSLSYLSAHINGSSLISAVVKALASVLVTLIQGVSLRDGTVEKDKLFTPKMVQKVEKLWMDLLTCMQSRHGGPFDSDLLNIMSPLLEVTLCHPKRQFRNQAVLFWNATFALSSSLEYPDSIRSVLQSAKDKMSLNLPNWNNVEVPVTDSVLKDESEDTSLRTFAQPRSLAWGILGSPQRRKTLPFSGDSPQLVKGSFQHKAAAAEKAVENLSPKKSLFSPKTVAQRQRKSPSRPHARRKLPLSLYEDDRQDYVAIAPSPKKTRLLTEHQKDVMKSKRVIPTLYNILDQSQDGTQFSTFTQDTTHNSPTKTSQGEAQVNQEPVSAVEKHSLSKASEHVHKFSEHVHNSSEHVHIASEHVHKSSAHVHNSSEHVHIASEHVHKHEDREEKSGNEDNQESSSSPARDDLEGFEGKARDLDVARLLSDKSDEYTVIPETMEIEGFTEGAVRHPSVSSADKAETQKSEQTFCPPEGVQTPPRDQQAETRDINTTSDVTPTNEVLPESITSPDVIPSSQTCSDLESPFRSLRRVSIPLPMFSLPLTTARPSAKTGDGFDSPKRVPISLAGNTRSVTTSARKPSANAKEARLSGENVESSDEKEEKEDLSEDRHDVEFTDQEKSSNSRKHDPKRSSISPVAGRTRRKARSKANTSTHSRKARLAKSKIKRKSSKDENEDKNSEHNTEMEDAPLITPQVGYFDKKRDLNTSPVSSPQIKFVRSLAITASPSRGPLSTFHSPAVSPSGGILKRFPAKQAVDSPSPPEKVRRVSFALPPQDSKASQSNEQLEKLRTDECAEKSTSKKEANKQTFTAIKPRPSLVNNSKATLASLQEGCMYPDLLQCNLPVEQVLPSLNTTWSRALGQVVHAQNIRTVGNLSALKDYQVRNLPIMSPKVETLKRVLRNFHQSQQKVRGLKDKVASSISARRQCVNENAGVRKVCAFSTEGNVGQEARKSHVESETVITGYSGKEEETGEILEKKTEEDCLAKEKVEEEQEKLGEEEQENATRVSVQEKSYTPPLSTNANLNSENKILETPKRSTSTHPTALFSHLEAREQLVCKDMEDKDMEVAGGLQSCEAQDKPTCMPLQVDAKLPSSEESEKLSSKGGLDEIRGKEEGFPLVLKQATENEISESSPDSRAQGKNTANASVGRMLSPPDPSKEPEETAETDGETFCKSLASAVELASPEVLRGLSSDDVFRAHQNLSDLMCKVVDALRSRWQSPKH